MPRHDMPIDLRALQAFSAVCSLGSMTAAAKRLGVSQSAISQSIASLEREQGSALLDRDSRPPKPNAAGRALYELAGPLLEHASAVMSRFGKSLEGGNASVRFGCVDSFAATVGPELIRAMSAADRHIALWSGLTPGLSKQLHDREIDLAVCTQTAIKDDRIVEIPLFSEAFFMVVSRSYFKRRTARNWRAVIDELPMIRYTARSVIGQQIERFAKHLGIVSPRRFEFDATDPLLSLVVSGVGFAISTPLCMWQARHYLKDIAVIPLPPGRLARREFFLLHREQEWNVFANQILTLTQSVLDNTILPQLAKAIPELPDGSIVRTTML